MVRGDKNSSSGARRDRRCGARLKGYRCSALRMVSIVPAWVVVLLIRFAMAAVDAYKTVFDKGPDGEMTFPEFEEKMASFSRGGGREENGPSSTTTSDTGSQEGAGDLFDDFRVNPILREDDPFGQFFDS